MSRPITADPYKPGFVDSMNERYRKDVAQGARRQVKLNGKTMRPTPQIAEWIAGAGMTDRVQGVHARKYLVNELRRLTGVDEVHSRPGDKLSRDDIEWVEHVARELHRGPEERELVGAGVDEEGTHAR